LFRYDFASGSTSAWTIPYNTAGCSGRLVEGLGQIELGKDGRLYIPHVGGCQITVVENPEAAGPAFRLLDVNTILSTGVSDHIQSELFEEPLLAQVDRSTICPGEGVQLRASGGSGNYAWKPAPGLQISANNGTAQAQPAITTTYTLYAATAFGCLDSAQVTVEVNRPLKPAIEVVGNNPVCGNTAAALRATKELSDYVWTANGIVVAGASADSLIIREPGRYRVSGMSNGCPVSSEEVTVEPSFFVTPAELFVPNVITPDQDENHANETFTIQNYAGRIGIIICNRWGREVYRTNNYQNNWAAEGLPGGLYYYHLTQENGCFPPKRGWVQVLR
jgi:hypothetical protein